MKISRPNKITKAFYGEPGPVFERIDVVIKITNTISIDESEIEEKFIRIPGAGEQKVKIL